MGMRIEITGITDGTVTVHDGKRPVTLRVEGGQIDCPEHLVAHALRCLPGARVSEQPGDEVTETETGGAPAPAGDTDLDGEPPASTEEHIA